MKTYTADQFKQKYGEQGLAKFEQTPAQSQGYLARVGSDIKSSLGEAFNSEKASASGQMNPLAAGANIFKNVTGAVISPLAEAPGFKQLGQGFGAIGQAAVDSPVGQSVTDTIAKKVPYQAIGTASDVAEGGLNTFGLYGATESVGKGLAKTKSTVKDFNTPGPEAPPTDPNISLQTAIKDATPDYEASSPTERGKMLGRVQEGGFLKGRTVKPDNLNVEAGTELHGVPGYDPNATKLAKYQVAQTENTIRAKALDSSLEREKVIVPKKEVVNIIKNVVNKVPEDSLLLAKADPVIKNYMRVVQNAVNKVGGNLKGVLDLKKLLDNAYENARGKQAFGSDKLSALDEIHKPVRDALTQYLVEKAQNTQVKASLRSQWNLYRAMDELRTAAEKESGSILGRTMKKYPITTKVVKSIGNATGIGGAMNVIGGQ